MAKPPSFSVAPGDRRRSRILSWGGLAGMIGLAAAGLVLVFPQDDLLRLVRGDGTGPGDRELTVAYLQNMVRASPRDANLRLLLAGKLLAAGDLQGARQMLDEAQPLIVPASEAAASWERQDFAWHEARLQQALGRDRNAEVREAVNALLLRLQRRAAAATQPRQVLAALDSVRALEAVLAARGMAASPPQPGADAPPALAQRRALLQRLQDMPAATTPELERGGALAQGDGEYAQASTLYFAARNKSTDPAVREQLLRRGVQALLAGGQPVAAWEAARREAGQVPATDPLHGWLIELAQSAGQPREAARLLRESLPLASGAAALARSVDGARLQKAWEIFLGGADLDAAAIVADAALVTAPGAPAWLERKANVAQWRGRPAEALAAWVALMKTGSALGMANVFRMAPMLLDDDALLAAWKQRARQRPLTDAEVAQVSEIYENLGSVDDALAFVREQNADAGRVSLSVLEAQLLERAGRPAQALAVLEKIGAGRLLPPDLLRLARLQLQRGGWDAALRTLREQQARFARLPFDFEYWDLLADVAYEAGDGTTALAALRQLIAQARQEPYQSIRAVRILQLQQRVPEALALARQLYPRTPQDELVYAWMDAIAAAPTPAALRELQDALLPAHRRTLEASPVFLERRAVLAQQVGDMPAARRDFLAALALRPLQTDTRSAYWWLLIDQRDASALRTELARWAGAMRGAANAEVLGAAWQLLDQPRLALAALRPLARQREGDFLWLMNYADLLERAGRVEAALAMRQHAWVLAQRAAASARNTAAARSALFAQLRMAAQFAGGEQKARLWRALGESMRAPNDPQATAAMSAERRRQERDLVGAWLLSQGRFDAAQRWLWEQQAARQAVPAYQKMALAIESGDKDALADALELAAGKVSGEIDPRDRLTALRQLGRTAEAATEGSLQAMAAPEGVPEELDLLLRQDLLTQASRAQAVVTQRRTGALERRTWQAQGSLVLVPSTRLQIDALNSSNRTLDTTRLAAVPAHDRELAVSLGTVARWGEAQLGVFVREALATVVGARLRLTQRLSEKSSLQLELAHNERAEESTALALAGMRDRAAVRLNLRASERVDGELSLSAQRYRTQHGSRLGTGADASATVNWYLRRDDPDLRLQFQLRRSVTRADGTLDAASAALVPAFAAPDASFYLPAGGTAIAATLGWGLNRTDPLFYGHTMRPWAEVGLETRRGQGVTQTQPLLRAGIKGGVWGRDQLSLQFEVRPGRGIGGGAAAGSESTREIRAQYDLFFDR